jgi:hypothetical protein
VVFWFCKRAIYKEDGWSSVAAINLVSVTNIIGGCNLARTHLNDSLSSLDRNAEATEKDAFENVDPQMLNSGRRKRFVLHQDFRMFSEPLQ